MSFCAGTRLMTLRGEVPVETVGTGDRAVTLSGIGSTLKPVAWVGSVQVDLDRHPAPHTAAPVRIRAGAVEPGMPIRDLLVSPDHGIALEDDRGRKTLVPALYLVNGATVRREPSNGMVTYHQIELEAHDILMGDGMAAESYLDCGDRAVFSRNILAFRPRDLAAAAPDLMPGFMPAHRDPVGCVRQLLGEAAHKVHARLLAAALEAGHTLTDDPDLVVTVAGAPAELVSGESGEYLFLLPPGAAAVRIHSRTHVPNDLNPQGGDTRRLGVALTRVLHDGTALPLDGPHFGAGFLPAESGWRWTTGAAELLLAPSPGETTLELHVPAGWSRYWLTPS